MDDHEPDQNGSFGGNAVVMIIALSFLVGLVPLGNWTFSPILNSIRSMSWETTEAFIVSSFVDVPSRRQYRLETEYNYRWDDDEFTSNRVFFDNSVGLRRQYYHRINREFLLSTETGNSIEIWVNPKAPEQSVIYRQIRWDKSAVSLFFYALFCIFTFGLVSAVVSSVRENFQSRQ